MGTLLLVLFLRSRRHGYSIPGTSDPEAVYVNTLGTLYAIYLAFMIFVVWTRFYEAVEAVEREANDVTGIFHLAEGLPTRERIQVQGFCVSYADAVLHKEWPAMARGEDPSATRAPVRRMWLILAAMNSDKSIDPVLRDHILGRWMDLTDLRGSRLLQSRISLPGVLYAVLLLGAVVTIAAAALFPAEDMLLHCLKAGLLAVLISLMLYAVVALDRPFQGAVHVTSTPFEHAFQLLRQ